MKKTRVLELIATSDKTWVHRCEMESKRRSVKWKSPFSPVKLSTKKIVLIFFWNIKGPILAHFQEHHQKVTCATYYALLREKVKPAIHSKISGMLSKILSVPWQCTYPCSSEGSNNNCDLNVFLIPFIALKCCHTVISPLIHLKRLRGCRLTSDGKVKEVVQTWIQDQLKNLFCQEWRS